MFSFLKKKTTPTAPSHTAGVKQGNAAGSASSGESTDGTKATARRSTGINPEARAPIDPRMPNLPPA
ncbi:MAG TPA: hypothetical protein VH853_11050 [Polyangia bacterium]|jgi:hypothetical protein|nr:hypothetical protein [Polyangia bacterium]